MPQVKTMSGMKSAIAAFLEANAKYMQGVDPADRFELERMYGRAQAYDELGTTTLEAAERAKNMGGGDGEKAYRLLATMAWAADQRAHNTLQEMQVRLVRLTSHLSRPQFINVGDGDGSKS